MIVTVQSARSRSWATGRPTRLERPTITALRPDNEPSASCSSIETPSGVHGTGKSSGAPGAIAKMLEDTEVVFNAAKAGVRVVDAATLRGARRLRVAADANAVPPSGIEGVGAKDNGVALETTGGVARGLGALAIGDVKYRVHTGLLSQMHDASRPLYLAHEEAFALARSIVG